MNKYVKEAYFYMLTKKHRCYYFTHEIRCVIERKVVNGETLKRTRLYDSCNICEYWNIDRTPGLK